MNLLCLLSAGDLSSANGPNGLVGNDNLAPVTDLLLEGRELASNDLQGLASLTLFQGLTTAPDDADAVFGRELGLGGNNVVALAEDGSALGVTKDGPVDARVLQLGDGDLASEGTVGLAVDVLSSNSDVLVLEMLTDEKEVQCGRCNDGLYSCSINC